MVPLGVWTKDNNKPSGTHVIMSQPLPVTFELCDSAATPYTAEATSTSNKLSVYPKPRAKWTVGRVSLEDKHPTQPIVCEASQETQA